MICSCPSPISPAISTRIRLNPLPDLYYSTATHDGICVHGNSRLTFLIFSIAFIVLVIALINHVNASLVLILEKTRELSIRRVIGASAGDNARLLFLMTVFSILISCMGLFSISLFTAKTRTKEIGIRKVVSAGMSDLMMLLNRDFLKWVLMAFVLSIPASWYAMDKWLGNFAYRTTLDWWIFFLAGAIALLVATLTVSWQTWRAAVKNPVDALRTE